MKKFLSLVVLLPIFIFAENIEISGTLSQNTTLDVDTAFVTGEVLVPAGVTLEVEPGTVVFFEGDYEITVQGKIDAVGALNDSIKFCGDNTWNSVRLEDSAEDNIFEYCLFENGTEALQVLSSKLNVRYCHFDGHDQAIDISGFSDTNELPVVIEVSLIENCQKNGIFIVQKTNVELTEVEIRNCALSGQPRGAIQLSCQSASATTQASITNCHIHDNVWQGVTTWDLTDNGNITLNITESLIERNLTGLYFIASNVNLINNTIKDNFVENNPNSGAGIMVSKASSNVVISGCEITGNFTGLYVTEDAAPMLGDLSSALPFHNGENNIHDNVDMYGNEWSIYSASAANIKAENNMWGHTDPDEIAETIYDGNDDPSLGIVDFDPIYIVGIGDENTVKSHSLTNYPNPFNPTTKIQFASDYNGEGKVVIYNAKGAAIFSKDVVKESSVYSFEFDGKELSSGTYMMMFRMNNGGQQIGKKITLIK